jgi:hypothetical protein
MAELMYIFFHSAATICRSFPGNRATKMVRRTAESFQPPRTAIAVPFVVLLVLAGSPALAQPRPLLEYRFEEGFGTTVASSGSVPGVAGTLREGKSTGNGPRFSQDTPQGIGSAFSLQFDGINDQVRVPDGFNYTVDGQAGSAPLSQLTIEAWVKPAVVGGRLQRSIWVDYGSPGVYFALYDDIVQLSVTTSEDPGTGISNYSGKLTAGVWQHIAAVYDGTQLKIYVDGQETGVNVATSGPIQDNSSVRPSSAFMAIGAENETLTLAYGGLIDDLRIYGVALSREQLAGGFFASQTAAPAGVQYTIGDRGAVTFTTSGAPPDFSVGYGRAEPGGGTPAAVGLAIFGFRQNGALVTEAGVQASGLTRSGRIPAFIGSGLDTGIAIANPFTQEVSIDFYFTGQDGVNLKSGSTVIPPYSHIARFLTQEPFSSGSPFQGTFTFASSGPVAAIALRGLLNERNEFLITTLPVVDITAPATDPVVVPHFADGGGWTTEILLVNPGNNACAGTMQFYDQGSDTTPGRVIAINIDGTTDTSFSYSIPGRSARRLRTSDPGSSLKAGSVAVTPTSGQSAPTVLVVFSLNSGGVTVTEAGVSSMKAATASRMYVEAGGRFGEPGSLQSGFAVSNPSPNPVPVRFELTTLSGASTGLSTSMDLPGRGQRAMFLNQIDGFQGLPASFQGALRISTSAPTGLVVTGLRSRFNERGDFLITTTAAADEALAPSTAERYFPQIADGGGYTTQFILLSGLPGQILAGRVRFFSSSGQPLDLDFP